MLLHLLLTLASGSRDPGCIDRALAEIGRREFGKVFEYSCYRPEEQALKPLWDSLAEPLSVCGGAAALFAADTSGVDDALRRTGAACARAFARNRDSARAADLKREEARRREREEDEADWAEELATTSRDTVDRAVWAPIDRAAKGLRARPTAPDLQGFPGDIDLSDTRDSLDALVDSCHAGPVPGRETCSLSPDESMEYPFGEFAVDRYSIEFLRDSGTPVAVVPVSVEFDECADAARAKAATILDLLARFSGPGAVVAKGPRFGTRSCGDLTKPGPARWAIRSGPWEVVVDSHWSEGEFFLTAEHRYLPRDRAARKNKGNTR